MAYYYILQGSVDRYVQENRGYTEGPVRKPEYKSGILRDTRGVHVGRTATPAELGILVLPYPLSVTTPAPGGYPGPFLVWKLMFGTRPVNYPNSPNITTEITPAPKYHTGIEPSSILGLYSKTGRTGYNTDGSPARAHYVERISKQGSYPGFNGETAYHPAAWKYQKPKI